MERKTNNFVGRICTLTNLAVIVFLVVSLILAGFVFYQSALLARQHVVIDGLRANYEAYIKELRWQFAEKDNLMLCYVDGLEDYAEQVTLLNVDLHDTLIDSANQIRMLRQQTVPIAQVGEKPKRTTRAKKEAAG